jgi:hypothetical protein
MAMPPTPLNG